MRMCGRAFQMHQMYGGSRCCSYCMFCAVKIQEVEEHVIVPLRKVNLTGTIEAGHATLNAQLTYVNQQLDGDRPIECTFKFELAEKTVVSKLVATINEKTVQAVIKEKQEAKEKYDDAIAAGNAAVYAETTQKILGQEITLLLGNLPSGQEAVIDVQMAMQLPVV